MLYYNETHRASVDRCSTAMEINIRLPTNFVITPRLGGLKRRNFHQELWEMN